MSTRQATQDERRLLCEVIARRGVNLQRLLDLALAGTKLTAEEANRLRDAIADELAATGVDPDTGAVNARGRRLDELIDLVAALSALHDE